MFRVAALVLTVFLVLFTYVYSNASYEQQQRLPAPVRQAANDVLYVIADLVNGTNDSLGSKLRQGIRRAGSEIKSVTTDQPEKPVEGVVLAMNQDLTGADYTAQLLPKSTFTRSILTKANFTKAYLDQAALDSATATEGLFNQTILTGASARGADFSSSNFNDADLTGLMAQGALFNEANFNITLLSSAQFSGASFRAVNMIGSYGDKSIFFGADFTDAIINGSDFTKANFDQAVFHNAVLTDAHLERATLKGADFSGADLSLASGLTQKQLDEACGDEVTKLPEGLTLLTCDELARLQLAASQEAARNESESGNINRN